MKRKNSRHPNFICWATTFVFLLTALNACSGMSGKSGMDDSQDQQPLATFGKWTWVSGDNKTDQRGVYGTLGVAAAENKPGARSGAVGWIDSEDNLWLFGGHGYADKRITQSLNDLWKYDGSVWTWVSGDDTGSEHGIYGTKGVASAGNKPGGRSGAVSWVDAQGNLWLFGGEGNAGKGFLGYLNDLWKFDGREWTWVSGGQKINRVGEYGERGITAPTNMPGARYDAVGWTDAAGNLWLFGGRGYDQYGAGGYLNDLWKFDGINWTWVCGDSTVYEMGDYGTMGVASDSNKPGARSGSASWVDSNGNFSLLGGYGNANIGWKGVDVLRQGPENSGAGYLNDLWKFDGSNWIWVSGDSKAFFGRDTSFGPRLGRDMDFGTTEIPSARFGTLIWLDHAENIWLFGGNARVKYGTVANDLWKYDGTDWIQIFAGIERKERRGIYGTKGDAAETNTPPARSDAVGWTDSEGNLWLFGGEKPSGHYFSDLWKYEPQDK